MKYSCNGKSHINYIIFQSAYNCYEKPGASKR